MYLRFPQNAGNFLNNWERITFYRKNCAPCGMQYVGGCVGGGWRACSQLITFIQDTVHVLGKHFTCCTVGFHICVRSCLLTRHHSVKAPSEGCCSNSNSTTSHPTEGTAHIWGSGRQMLVLVARNICKQKEVNFTPVPATWNFSKIIKLPVIIYWGQLWK